MTSMEFLGGNSAVENLTNQRALEKGRAAAERIKQTLIKFVDNDTITQEQLDDMARQEHSQAADKYAFERQVGKHNDLYSLNRGVTVLVTASALVDFREQRGNTIPSLFEQGFEEVDTNSDKLLYRARFPEGGYTAPGSGGSVVSIIPDADIRTGGWVRDKLGEPPTWSNSLRTSALDVVRIEGDSGELWQNPFYTPEGAFAVRPTTLADI